MGGKCLFKVRPCFSSILMQTRSVITSPRNVLYLCWTVAAMGLDPAKYLGKELAFLNAYLHKLKELYGINVCCEGGEYETLILDYPLFSVKKGEIVMKGQVRYFELKQLILLSYCQVITFYLLVKSKGQPVYDHPIIARLEEIKKLLDQVLLFSK
ncbi:Diphthine--ammonia ligase [Glycine soja]